MKYLLKNLTKGAASVNLAGYFFDDYESQTNKSLEEIRILSKVRNISLEKALKQYFSEIYWGQILMFFSSMLCLGLIVWLAYNKFDNVYFILPIIVLNLLLIGPKLLVIYYFNHRL